MSSGAERIFGIYDKVEIGGNAPEAFRARIDASTHVFFLAFDFLRKPGEDLQNPFLARLAYEVLQKENQLETVINSAVAAGAPRISWFKSGAIQVQLPADYLEIKETSPGVILCDAVWVASKVRDIKRGRDLSLDDSKLRAEIAEAEFLHWWDETRTILGIDDVPSTTHEALKKKFPLGIKSPLAQSQLRNMGVANFELTDYKAPKASTN